MPVKPKGYAEVGAASLTNRGGRRVGWGDRKEERKRSCIPSRATSFLSIKILARGRVCVWRGQVVGQKKRVEKRGVWEETGKE